MKTITEYLDIAKEQSGSDYRTAQLIGVAKQTINNWRKNGSIKEDNLIELANLIDEPFEAVIAAYHYHRTTSPLAKKAWSKLSRSAAACLIVVTSMGYNSDESYAQDLEAENGTKQVIYYTQYEL